MPSEDLQADVALSLQQFSLQLLAPKNDAVVPLDHAAPAGDLNQPLAHYWTACSHSISAVIRIVGFCTPGRIDRWFELLCLFGDQLTGVSTEDCYNRQLVQGCRFVEINCWDGESLTPMVTHGDSTMDPSLESGQERICHVEPPADA
eukprot:1501084-Prymnesium_polylepis.1